MRLELDSYDELRCTMKKKIIVMMLLVLLFKVNIHANEEITLQAKSAYLVELSSGKVLFEKNSQDKLFPASMTKMMSLILVFEAINENKLTLDEMITVSAHAASMGGSQVFLEPNEQISVHDLLKSTIIASANDAMVALAERVSGSVNGFVDAMNKKAKTYGLVNTNFVNTTGLHDENHYTCAKDMATIAMHLIQVGGNQLFEYSKTYDAYIREKSPNPFWLVNTNKLIKYVEGVDGLKTGFTQEAKSCITVTALRNNLRLIGVVMGEPDSKIRNQEASDLLDLGFGKVEYQALYNQNDFVEKHQFDLGKPKEVDLIYLNDVGVVIDKNEPVEVISKEVTLTQNFYPYRVNEKVGEAKLTFNHGDTLVVPIGVSQEVQRLSYLELVGISFWRLLT